MKLTYSSDDVERWRDKTHYRTRKTPVNNERQVLAFINSVGFCLASNSDGLDLPNLWDAVTSSQPLDVSGDKPGAKRGYSLSYAREIQHILPNHHSVYYGKMFRRKPSVISAEYFMYFYALTERTGAKDEYKTEYVAGKLSPVAKQVMDILMKSAPMTSKDLRNAMAGNGKKKVQGLERALDELQRKMFVCRVVGNGHTLGAEWAPVTKCFPAEVRRAARTSSELARYKLLEKYFHNQLISSIDSIHNVFGWSKQTIYHSIGQLVQAGVITTTVGLDGKQGKFYCLVH